MQSRHYFYHSLVITTLLSPALVTAEQKNIEKLDSVVVVASRAPKQVSDIAGTVWLVDKETVEEQSHGGKNLSDILSTVVPSLDVGSQGRTNYGQNLRGRAMLVMIDGVSLNSARSISRQLDSIDPFNIERIEVLSGATAIYGAGASGGVINIITKRAEAGELTAETYVGGSSGFNNRNDGDYKIAQSISAGTDKLKARGSLVYSETNAFYDANGELINPDSTQGSLQFNETIDLMGSLEYKLDDQQTVTLLAQHYNSEQNSPYGTYFGENLAGSKESNHDLIETRKGFSSDRNLGTERYLFNATYHHEEVFGHELIVQASYRKESFSYNPFIRPSGSKEPSNKGYFSASKQDTDVFSLRTALVKSFDKLTLSYGVDGYIDQFENDQIIFDQNISNASGGLVNKKAYKIGRYPDTEVSSIAGFFQVSYQLTDRLLIEGGYRYQYMRNEVDDFIDAGIQKDIAFGKYTSADPVPGGQTHYKFGLFNLGAVFDLTANQQVWANFSQGFELPDTAKRYGDGQYVDANGDGHAELVKGSDIRTDRLDGIKTDSYELGWRYTGTDLSVQTALYYSESDKVATYKNLLLELRDHEKRVYGFEFETSYWATDKFQLGLTGHYVKTQEKDKNGHWQRSLVDSSSASKAGAWVGWYEDKYSLKLQSQTLFSLRDDAKRLKGKSENGELSGYTTVDFLGNYKLPVGDVGFGVQNVFNREYTTIWSQRAQKLYSPYYGPEEAYDFKGRGRTFFVNYQVKY
ncbi:TonB-dependent receptor [Endozoicomonas sp. SM1973]|uniref:Ferric aerobactin receptor n=1 Tax=Spartinivicinus marinus TaxID=2994442 RepID=A0A853HZ98_9GAMM|nr:TonB-dependent receptor [Spartinivicinus marinus]MCX4028354.1 TonB-dependent receptor [Spartinivicinus marinus]NYZ65689.1 TonB-dependent receptor [Spartinivicinus marinus]